MNARLWFAALGVLVSACASSPPIQTASGQPEFTLTNVDPVCVRGRVLNGMVNNGFAIRSTMDTQIVGGKERGGDIGLLYATRATGFPEHRVTVLMIPLGGSMRIVFSEAIVSNAGTGFERSNPIRQSQDVQMEMVETGVLMQEACGL